MKIFGSISELVDLAFRLAGGKQVKLRSATQTTSGSVITVNVPDVVATGDTQNMVLTAATQTLSNKTLSSPTITAGTINNAVIGGSTPAAGSFTAIVGSTLDINTSAELQTLTIPSFSTAGVLHNNSSGAVSSSLIVDADVAAAAAIAFSKLASLPSDSILIGSATNVATAASNAAASDISISYSAGEVTLALKSGIIVNADVNASADIDASKIKATTVKRPIVADSTGLLKSSPTALTDGEVLYWDATNGEFKSVTGISYQEVQALEGLSASPTILTQLGNKANNGSNSDITEITGLTTMLAPSQGGTGVNNGSNTLTLAGPLATSGNFTTTLTATNNTSLTLPTSGTLATTSNKLSAFASTSSSELAGVISDETGSGGALVFANAPALDTPTLNGHYLGSGSASIASSTLTPAATKSLQLIATAGNFGMISSPVAGQQYVLVNESASDITIQNLTGATAANQIYTGTGADYTFKAKSAVSVVYDGTLSKWMLTGGGGAGGLSTSYVTAGGITAVASTHYLTNLSASGQTITLPAGVNGSVIRFSDAGEKWDVYPLTIAPATGEKIDNLATNESLVCDVKRGWVELSYNSSFGGWALMSLASTEGSGSGSGQVNAILNPDAAAGTTGWTGVTQVSSGSPLDPIVSSAFSISNAAAAESSTSGGYYSIASLAPGLKSKKLQVSFYFSTPATDVYRVSVYAGSTRLSLSSDSSGATTLPANVTGGYFTATFDSTTASAYSLNVTRTSGTTGACVITQVIVGPGINAQGAAISEWQTYTPTFSAGVGSASTINFWYRRVGSDMEIQGSFLTGTVAASAATFTLPSNLTVGNSAIAVRSSFGIWHAQAASAGLAFTQAGVIIATALGANTIGFDYQVAASTSLFSARNGNTIFNSSSIVTLKATIPIAEWAGNGTVNLGAGAQVEYASTSGTWDADSSTTVYGPQGTAIGGSLSTSRSKTVTWQYPLQADDVVIVEGSSDQLRWYPLNNGHVGPAGSETPIIPGMNSAGTAVAGVFTKPGSATTSIIVFGQYAYIANDDAPAANWPSTFAYWRVRKSKASAPVGFGMADSNNSGLIKPRKGSVIITDANKGTYFSTQPAGFTVIRGAMIYYQDQDGNHRLKFNIVASATTAVTIQAILSGVTFKNVANYFQPVSCLAASNITQVAYVTPNTGSITVETGSTQTQFRVSGDVELESKPTWA